MKRERDDWDEHWAQFSAAATWNPAQIMRHRLILRTMEGQGLAPFNILDIGCGQGDFLARAAAHFPSAHLAGMELSVHGAEITRRKVPQAEVFIGNLLDPSMTMHGYHGWAHLAVCSEVLEHVDEPEQLLRSAAPYLMERGKLIVTVPGGPMSAFDRRIGHRQHFTRKSVGDLMRKSGFFVEKIYSAGFPFFNLYRLAIIVRGERVAKDAIFAASQGKTSAKVFAKIFEKLFFFNLHFIPFGWQIVAVGRKQ
jgi:SAM-dependent methyltransferase